VTALLVLLALALAGAIAAFAAGFWSLAVFCAALVLLFAVGVAVLGAERRRS
jgi:hypothetical protein